MGVVQERCARSSRCRPARSGARAALALAPARTAPTESRPLRAARRQVPEIAISQCGACNRFFHAEEWEAAVLAQAQCPFCRAPQTAE